MIPCRKFCYGKYLRRHSLSPSLRMTPVMTPDMITWPPSWGQPAQKVIPISGNSTKRRKPAKPYPGFPLFPHATGRWAKKIKGRLHYFGPWVDPQGALQKYLDQRDDLHAGRTPRVGGDGPTIRELCNRYLTAKKLLADSGEIQRRTWHDNHKACGRIIDCFGRERLVEDLRPEDFEKLRGELSRTMGLRTLKTEMQRVRYGLRLFRR